LGNLGLIGKLIKTAFGLLKVTTIMAQNCKTSEDKSIRCPDYDKYNAVLLYAAVSDNLNDKDLKEMSGEAMVMMQLDKLSLFLNPFRTVFEETCTLKNVTYNWLDQNELIYRGTMRTFVEAEKQRIEWIKGHPESK
jgi:hypothetical protein